MDVNALLFYVCFKADMRCASELITYTEVQRRSMNEISKIISLLNTERSFTTFRMTN